MSTRLLASGCSSTDYCWTTWPSILGKSYDDYLNLGIGGADNATIARDIIQHARKGDTVVILWTGFDRLSLYIEEGYPMPKFENNHWRHLGTLVWDKEFWSKYYHPVERFTTSMDYVQLVDIHSKQHGYTAYHFSAVPWLLGESEANVDPRLQEIYGRYTIDNNHLLDLSLDEWREQNGWMFKTPFEPGGSEDDPHTTPLAHWHFCEEILAPIVGVELEQNQLEDIKQEQERILKGERGES